MEAKPKMGRPPKPADEQASEIVALRLTADERAECERAAKRADVKLSAWIRSVVLRAARRR
jgi:hypothetical protein